MILGRGAYERSVGDYLEDHMAAAGLAIDLLQSMKARSDEQSLSQFAASILVDVEQDEKALHDFAKAI
jgi:hypothetical protein